MYRAFQITLALVLAATWLAIPIDGTAEDADACIERCYGEEEQCVAGCADSDDASACEDACRDAADVCIDECSE